VTQPSKGKEAPTTPPSLTTRVDADTTNTLCERLTCITGLGFRNPRNRKPLTEEGNLPLSFTGTSYVAEIELS